MKIRTFLVKDHFADSPSKIAERAKQMAGGLGIRYIPYDDFCLTDLKNITMADEAPSEPCLVEYTMFCKFPKRNPTSWLTYLLVCEYDDYKELMANLFTKKGFVARDLPF